MAQQPRILIEGRPGAGKTTVARRLAELLRDRGITVSGFTTEEIREARRRVGFAVESIAGTRAVLAHIDLAGPPRVGKYGVDVTAFERVALPALAPAKDVTMIIDEIGKMELASARFRDAVMRVLDSRCPLIATVHVFRNPFTDALKARDDVEIAHVTERNRNVMPRELVDRLLRKPRR